MAELPVPYWMTEVEPCLVLDFSGKAHILSPWRMIVAVDARCSLSSWDHFPLLLISLYYYYFFIINECSVLVALLCLALCDATDCSVPNSSVHGILQAKILEWVAIPFFRRDLPDPRIKLGSPALQKFTDWATTETLKQCIIVNKQGDKHTKQTTYQHFPEHSTQPCTFPHTRHWGLKG